MRTTLFFVLLAIAACKTPAGSEKRTLRDHLEGAKRARVFAKEERGYIEKRIMDQAETKAYLARIDLGQVPNGPLVRCPSDQQIRFENAGGETLGTIGTCGGAARFDAPGAQPGGIRLK